MAENLSKPQILFLAVKSWQGESIEWMMTGLVEEFNKTHGAGLHSWGIALEDDGEHDNKVHSAVNKIKFDIISFGGGIRAHSAWGARVAGIFKDSINKDTKLVYPEIPQEAAPFVLQAAKEMGFKPPHEM